MRVGNIDWIAVEDAPEHVKDGRPVLFWDGERAYVGWWDMGAPEIDNDDAPIMTHFAEINPPE